MTRPLIGMTVCSGIGAPECAAPWIDWRYQSEIDKFPCAVLASRFPHAVNLGDMTKFKEWPDANVDVLCGGTPCQSFSVAGLRKGLADPRGNLMLTYLAIADRYRPKWLVWENVPGVLSSNGGRDFGTFLGGLAELGYGFAYRVLDAQYVRVESHPWAVPQRRRRVFVVGYLGDWRRAAAVLFERESLSGHPAPRREAGQAAPTIPSRRTGGGGLGTDFDCDGGLIESSSGSVAHCLNAGGMGRIDYETETMIAHALRGEGHDASEDGTGRGTPIIPIVAGTMKAMNESGGWSNSVDHAASGYMLPIAIQGAATRENPNAGPDGIGVRTDGAAYTLEARQEVQAVAYGIRSDAQREGVALTPSADAEGRVRLRNPGLGITENVAPTIDSGQPHAVCFDSKGTGVQTSEGAAPTLRSMSHADSHQNGGGQLAVALIGVGAIAHNWAVRRLTPLECERLQGFPDGWTDIAHRGKPAADGPRYKALGNSMAVNVMTWIFERIRDVEGLM